MSGTGGTIRKLAAGSAVFSGLYACILLSVCCVIYFGVLRSHDLRPTYQGAIQRMAEIEAERDGALQLVDRVHNALGEPMLQVRTVFSAAVRLAEAAPADGQLLQRFTDYLHSVDETDRMRAQREAETVVRASASIGVKATRITDCMRRIAGELGDSAMTSSVGGLLLIDRFIDGGFSDLMISLAADIHGRDPVPRHLGSERIDRLGRFDTLPIEACADSASPIAPRPPFGPEDLAKTPREIVDEAIKVIATSRRSAAAYLGANAVYPGIELPFRLLVCVLPWLVLVLAGLGALIQLSISRQLRAAPPDRAKARYAVGKALGLWVGDAMAMGSRRTFFRILIDTLLLLPIAGLALVWMGYPTVRGVTVPRMIADLAPGDFEQLLGQFFPIGMAACLVVLAVIVWRRHLISASIQIEAGRS